MPHSAWHQHPVMMRQVPCWSQFSMPRRNVCAAHGGIRMLPPAEQLLFVPSPNAGGAGFRFAVAVIVVIHYFTTTNTIAKKQRR